PRGIGFTAISGLLCCNGRTRPELDRMNSARQFASRLPDSAISCPVDTWFSLRNPGKALASLDLALTSDIRESEPSATLHRRRSHENPGSHCYIHFVSLCNPGHTRVCARQRRISARPAARRENQRQRERKRQ